MRPPSAESMGKCTQWKRIRNHRAQEMSRTLPLVREVDEVMCLLPRNYVSGKLRQGWSRKGSGASG